MAAMAAMAAGHPLPLPRLRSRPLSRPAMAAAPFPFQQRRSPPFQTPRAGGPWLPPPSLAWSNAARSAPLPDPRGRGGHGYHPLPLPAATLPAPPRGLDGGEDQAAVIDGKAIALQIKEEIAEDVARMKELVGKVPGLAVVLVGSRKDSMTYVRSKKKACSEVGIENFGVDLPEDVTEEEVLSHIRKYNEDPEVHGILVQLPLPRHLNEEKILGAVSIEKDVDGFNPMNLGKLAMSGREPLFVSCTPKGCIELLVRSGVEIVGKRAVVIGRSKVVGTPAAMLLQRHNATVSVVHSHTRDPAAVVRTADIVIAAVGVANLVRGDWLKPGAVVIDVGMNAVEDPSAKRGYRLVGDVCYPEAVRVASAITPVPGGVGPMTIAMLLCNTVISAKRAFGQT